MAWAWVYDPHSGGVKIPSQNYLEICEQVESFARTRPWYTRIQLKVRITGHFCYIDTVEEGKCPIQLCRLRHLNRGWSLALFTYSNERYEPCAFADGKLEGTLEAALKVCDPFVI
jgi:hypothetical protein